jgi:hypothetical protein
MMSSILLFASLISVLMKNRDTVRVPGYCRSAIDHFSEQTN